MTYVEALAFLYSLTDMERDPAAAFAPANFDLGRMESLLRRLGSPHLGRQTIHVAGSKGKGSTATMIAAILREGGDKAGLYTSPHLHRYEERIALDGVPISSERFAELAAIIAPAIEAEDSDGAFGRPSTFEALTAMGYLAFAEAGCAWQVIEVGLGGRLDATNVHAGEKTCVITPIGLEHTAILGDTVAAIAAEKAAIVQGPGAVIMAPQRESAADVIRQRCRDVGATLHEVAAQVKMRVGTATEDGRDVVIATEKGRYSARLPLLARQQADNSATAILACEQALGELNPATVASGLAAMKIAGRQEIIRRRPWTMVDVAHSEDSVRSLAATLGELGGGAVILVFAPLADKRLNEMAALLAPLCREVIASVAPHPRAATLDASVSAFRGADIEVLQAPGFDQALALASEIGGDRGRVVITGSFAAAAAAREHFLALAPAPRATRG